MAESNNNPYPLTFEEFKNICWEKGRSPWEAVTAEYITKDDYSNLGRGRQSKPIGRCLFFFARDTGMI